MSRKKNHSNREWAYRAAFILGMGGLTALAKITNVDALFTNNKAEETSEKQNILYQDEKPDYEQILTNNTSERIREHYEKLKANEYLTKNTTKNKPKTIDDKVMQTIKETKKVNETRPQEKEKTPINRTENFGSLDKKIFIYHQNLSSEDMMKEAMEICDYWMPHFYEINQEKIGYDKKHKENITKTVWKNRVKDKKLREIVKSAKSKNIMPMVSAFDKESVMSVLNNPDYYAKRMHEEIKKVGANGISIDLESIDVGQEESGKLVNFMKILRKEMSGYIITIAVSPRFEGSAEGGFKHHGFYNYKELSKYVDYVNVMSYDFHKGRVSPIMPAHLLEGILDYAEKNIPKDKIVPLFPLYSNVWEKNNKGKYTDMGALNSKLIKSFIEDNSIKSKYYIDGELRIETKNGKIVYGQDGTTFYNRLKRVDNHNIKNFGGWKQNHASKEMYDQMKYWKQKG